jgi:hypothetical protein
MHHCSQTSSDMKGSLALRVEAKSGTVMDTLGKACTTVHKLLAMLGIANPCARGCVGGMVVWVCVVTCGGV